jgi:hypothetical protein
MSKPKLEYSDAWCVCLEGLLAECGRWPIIDFSGGPTHWCPACYDDALVEGEDDDEHDEEELVIRALDFAMDAAQCATNTCDRGHKPPERTGR